MEKLNPNRANFQRCFLLQFTGGYAYGSDELYDGDLDEGDWDVNDADFTPGRATVVCAHEVRARFVKVKKLAVWPDCVCRKLF